MIFSFKISEIIYSDVSFFNGDITTLFICDGIEPHSGDYYFIVGALCNTVTYSEAYQEVDISEYTNCIDQNLAY